jgi:hypothetical protein
MPSSLQIRTELRALVADENTRERCAESEGLPESASWLEIVEYRRGVAEASRAASRRNDSRSAVDEPRTSINPIRS